MLFCGCFYDLWLTHRWYWCLTHYYSDEFSLLCSLAGSHLHVYMYVCVSLSWLNNVNNLWAALYEDVTSLYGSLSRFEYWVDTGQSVNSDHFDILSVRGTELLDELYVACITRSVTVLICGWPVGGDVVFTCAHNKMNFNWCRRCIVAVTMVIYQLSGAFSALISMERWCS